MQGLCEALQCTSSRGLDPSPAGSSGQAGLEQRRQAFGANEFREVPTKSFFALLFENLKDPTLLLLMAAALVSPASVAARCGCWRLAGWGDVQRQSCPGCFASSIWQGSQRQQSRPVDSGSAVHLDVQALLRGQGSLRAPHGSQL